MDGDSEVFVVDLSSGAPVGPTPVNGPLVAGGDVLDLRWSPDSTRLAYLADQDTDGVNELYVVDVSGPTPSAPQRVSPPA